jgi:hypothetical protein
MRVAGIDTWSVGWYLENSDRAEAAIRAIATNRAGRFDLVPDDVVGHRVLYDRGNRFLFAEGHPDPEGLCAVDAGLLHDRQEAIARELADRGAVIDRRPRRFEHQGSAGAGGVRRLDLTIDVRRPTGTGLAILRGVAAIEPPRRLRSVVHRSPVGHRIETVTWEGTKGKMARIYDKGVESGTDPAGARVRLEDQRRFGRGSRFLAEELDPRLAAAMFQNRFSPLGRATKGMTVTTLSRAVEKVAAAVRDGEMSRAQGQKLLGFLVSEREGADLGGDRTTAWRDRRRAREVGLVLADGEIDEVEIDVAEELGAALESGPWEE